MTAARSAPRATLAGLLAVLSTCGCVYSKQVTNAAIRDLDASRIVVGETTVADLLSTWGPPAPTRPLGLLTPLSQTAWRPHSQSFRYVSQETRCTSFLATTPADGKPVPVAPWLPFVWCDDQPVYAVVVEFDDDGVVERVTRGETRSVWRPWSGGGERRAQVETVSRPGATLP